MKVLYIHKTFMIIFEKTILLSKEVCSR